ncbi:MAG: hypothetical protein P1Q69_12745 [Candidatus Thorarchaeota archaeon]|nr:hypothetical protein [Candidatus Thorarchaeota archaeon]
MLENILTAIVFVVVGAILCFWICSKSICPIVRDDSVIGASARCPECGKCIAYNVPEYSARGRVICNRCGYRFEIAPIRQQVQ